MNDLKGIIEDVNKSDLVSKNVLEKIIRLIGQETWQSLNDIHSDIITTSGEVAITLRNLKRLEEENEQLKQSNWELLEKIEKMKNCANCKFGNPGDYDCFENCSSCTIMNCICDKTGKEMDWEEKCDDWELDE